METFDEGSGDGYVRELGYTFRYCPEIAPSRIALACAVRGLQIPPQVRTPRYLELAFGQGVSINIHAAACPGEHRGFDLNPDHVDHARGLAAASGAPVGLTCESFEDFAARPDEGPFDVIAMHGTWSWISPANRHLVVEILRKRLAPGGVCVISYNCMPGWAGELPLRHLLALHAQRAPASQGLAARIEASLAFAQDLLDAGAKYFDRHHGLAEWLRNMHAQDRGYLAHEYFNRDWHPMPSSDVAHALEGAGLEYGASTTLAGHDEPYGLEPEARGLLARVKDPLMRETVLDYLVDRRFRSDIFVRRGAQRDSLALHEHICDIAFTLLQHPDYVPSTLRVGRSEIELPAGIHRPFVAAMARDGYAPRTLNDIAGDPECAGITQSKLAEAALALAEAGYLHPAQPRQAVDEVAPRCRALNAKILERAATPGELPALACPVTGAGVFAARQEMLFLRAMACGHLTQDEWARYAWDTMAEGDPASLRSDAKAFAHVRLPLFESLGIA